MLASFLAAAMTTGLAVLSIVGALSIDNQLTPLVSDCFERLAIGERLNAEKVYKTFKHNTVADCKKACSEQRNSCKAFAFGISAKGNATCELSIDTIKETADLKPIGTVSDTDFDLYIKKLDCTLVIDKSPNHKPSDQNYQPSLKPVTLGNIRPEDEILFKPLDGHEPPNKPPHLPDLNHQYLHVPDRNPYGEQKPHRPPHPPDLSHHYRPSANQDGIHNVQTLVSVASGPQTVLNPVHGILVAGDSSGGYGGHHVEKLPPFRPEALNYPYDGHKTRPRPVDSHRPDPDYAIRPVHESSGDYAHRGPFQRPYGPVESPDLDRYDALKPESTEYYSDRYGDRPSRIPFRPQPSYFDRDRPLPNKYGSLIPHPDAYDKRPPTQGAYLFEHEHEHQEYHSEYYHHSAEDDPNYHYHRPSRPIQDYDDRRRPPGGDGIHGDDHHKPEYDDERPLVDGYDSYHNNKPVAIAGTYDEERPKPRPSHTTSEGYGPSNKPSRPSNPHSDGYGLTTKPNGFHDDERPTRPLSKPSEGYAGENAKPESYRPSVTKPYADSRPNINRPNSNKPYEDSSPNNSLPYEDSRPSVGRPHSNRPYDDSRPHSNRPFEDSRPHSNRPYDDPRPQSDRPFDDSRPHSNNPYDDSRPHSDRPYGDSRPHSDRPFDDSRPHSDRPYGDSRPNSDRPYADSRPHSSRPYEDEQPNRPKPVGDGLSPYHGGGDRSPPGGDKSSRPIVTHSTGYNGEDITSIITEIGDGK